MRLMCAPSSSASRKSLPTGRQQLQRLQHENSDALDKASVAISELETQKATRTQDRVFARQRMDANEKKSNILQNDIMNLDVDEAP